MGGGTGTGAQPDGSTSAGGLNRLSHLARTGHRSLRPQAPRRPLGSDSTSTRRRSRSDASMPDQQNLRQIHPSARVRPGERSDTATRRNQATSAIRVTTTTRTLHQGRTERAASGETTSASNNDASSDRPRTRRADTPARSVEDSRRAHRGSVTAAAGRDIWSHGMSTLHDNLRTRGTCGADGIRTWARRRQVKIGQRRATLQDAHGIREPVDRPGCGQVFTPADPVLEQIGSPNRDEHEEDKAAGLHKPKVRGVCGPC